MPTKDEQAELFGTHHRFKMYAERKGPKKVDLPEEAFKGRPSGETFEAAQTISQGADPVGFWKRQLRTVAFLSTFAGLRDPDTGEHVAPGAHSGHDRLDLQLLAAEEIIRLCGGLARTAYTSGGCDGNWQGRPEMAYSLVSRNTMFNNMRVQLGVFPFARAILGSASCDKEGPAMTGTIAHLKVLEADVKKKLMGMVIPGGSMLPLDDEKIMDTGTVQTVNSQTAYGHMTYEEAAEQLCHACTQTGGGCQFFGTAASQQAITEALGLIIPHGACVPSSTVPWYDVAKHSASFTMKLMDDGFGISDLLSQKSIKNAMVVMSATGASTNMFMHLAFIARAAGLEPPEIPAYQKIFQEIPRFLRVLPNGPAHEEYPRWPKGFPTAMFWAAGGVPEIMLQLREANALELDAMTVTGETVGSNLKRWEKSARRKFYREMLEKEVGVKPEHVIMPMDQGLPSSYTFPSGNLCDISVCKSSSINPELMSHGVYNKVGRARVFSSEIALREALNSKEIGPDDIICYIGRGILGSGLEEVYEFTAQIANIPELKNVAILTDARFSGVTTGACVGHVIPEALAGGAIGKLQDGDWVEINIDSNTGEASVNLIGSDSSGPKDASIGSKLLEERGQRKDLLAARLPEIVRREAALMHLGQEDWTTGYYPDNQAVLDAIEALGLPKLKGY